MGNKSLTWEARQKSLWNAIIKARKEYKKICDTLGKEDQFLKWQENISKNINRKLEQELLKRGYSFREDVGVLFKMIKSTIHDPTLNIKEKIHDILWLLGFFTD